jgi:hypothetical protein
MDDTVVVLRFTDLARARQALHDLKQLDEERRLQVRAAALMQRSGEGRTTVPNPADDDDGYFMPLGGSVGMLVEALGGPLGILFSPPAESFRGHGGMSPHEGERELLLESISRDLEPGVTIVVAEIADPDPAVLDPALKRLGGVVTRRAAEDVYAEVRAADEAASSASDEARRVLREQRAAGVKERLERFKDTAKSKLP